MRTGVDKVDASPASRSARAGLRWAMPNAGNALLAGLASMPGALVLFDVDGVACWASDAASPLLGLEPVALLGRSWDALFADGSRRWSTLADLVRVSGRPVTFTNQWRAGDGSVRDVEVTAVLARDGLHAGQHLVLVRLEQAGAAANRDPLVGDEASLRHALNRRSSDVALLAAADTTITYVSPSVEDVLGFTPDQVVGKHGMGFVHPEDLRSVVDFVARVAATPGHVERETFRIRNARGEWRWIEETLTNCMDVPAVGALVANIRDVTSEVETRAALTASERKYRTIVETAQEGVIVVDDSSCILFANQAAADMFGLARAALNGRDITGFFPSDTAEELRRRLAHRAEVGHERYEVGYTHPDGSVRWFQVVASPITWDADGTWGSLSMVSEVTEARLAEEQLRRRTLSDALTGLPNRTLLNDRLAMASMRTAGQTGCGPAVIYLDLDDFRLVNDAHGDLVGDAVLKAAALRLRDAVRPHDTVARFEGDEFVIIAEDVDAQVALDLAQKARAAVSRPYDVAGGQAFISASAGVSIAPPHDATVLLREAHQAMHQAKAAARGDVLLFDRSRARNAAHRLQLVTRLRAALDSDALELHYQPVVELASGRVVGVEALLRWTDEELGQVPPPDLVDAAHAMGRSADLDRWVVHRACQDMRWVATRSSGRQLRLSVNLSAQSLESSFMTQMVVAACEATGWPLDQLVLEVTESVLMTDPEKAAEALRSLRKVGVSVAIDDFGTGYSSLAYLKRLPVSVLKVDRSFVESVSTEEDSRSIAQAVVDLARALGLRTVAEGVETVAQAETMQRLGCDRGQGYLWSEAVTKEALVALLAGSERSRD